MLGVRIEAPSAVDPRAITAAKHIVEQMLSGSGDTRERLVLHHASLAIIPRDCYVTALPEFTSLSGRRDANGNAYDSFAIRGAGGVLGQTVTAVSEENLLKLPNDPFRAESIVHHEFAHAIMNLGFSDRDRAAWTELFVAATAKRLFPGAFAMTNADEFWAELSQSYFSVNNEINGAALIRSADPMAAAFLERVYGPAPHG